MEERERHRHTLTDHPPPSTTHTHARTHAEFVHGDGRVAAGLPGGPGRDGAAGADPGAAGRGRGQVRASLFVRVVIHVTGRLHMLGERSCG